MERYSLFLAAPLASLAIKFHCCFDTLWLATDSFSFSVLGIPFWLLISCLFYQYIQRLRILLYRPHSRNLGVLHRLHTNISAHYTASPALGDLCIFAVSCADPLHSCGRLCLLPFVYSRFTVKHTSRSRHALWEVRWNH